MAPRFTLEIQEYLRTSGPVTQSALAGHFSKWGADDEDIRIALAWLVSEGRVRRELDREERFRLVERAMGTGR